MPLIKLSETKPLPPVDSAAAPAPAHEQQPLSEQAEPTLQDVDDEMVSARRCAESAIAEFQHLSDTVSLEQAREAYARLMIGRGFDRKQREEKAHKTASRPALDESKRSDK